MSNTIKPLKPLNILFFSATVPYPALDGGRIRVLNLIRCLCKIHKVVLLTFISLPTDPQGIAYLEKMGVEVISIRLKLGNLATIMHSLFQWKPLTIAKYYSPEMLQTLRKLLESREFHIIHFEMLHTGQFISKLKSDKKSYSTFLGQQNIDSHIWYRLAKTEKNILKKILFYSQYLAFAGYEKRMCKDFDTCVCVSEQDKAKLASLCPEAAIEVVPNGVELDYFFPVETEEDEKCLVFTGSMDWHPNEDAVLYFCHDIFPLIKAKIPEISFYIVGSNPTERVLSLDNIQNVTVTGSVEDVRPYITKAAVYIVPLRVGGGTRLKIFQALAMKKAIVSTSIGCEGQELIPGEHIIVADNSWEFADSVVMLLKDRELRQKLGEKGRIFVQQRYDWNMIAQGLEELYRSHK